MNKADIYPGHQQSKLFYAALETNRLYVSRRPQIGLLQTDTHNKLRFHVAAIPNNNTFFLKNEMELTSEQIANSCLNNVHDKLISYISITLPYGTEKSDLAEKAQIENVKFCLPDDSWTVSRFIDVDSCFVCIISSKLRQRVLEAFETFYFAIENLVSYSELGVTEIILEFINFGEENTSYQQKYPIYKEMTKPKILSFSPVSDIVRSGEDAAFHWNIQAADECSVTSMNTGEKHIIQDANAEYKTKIKSSDDFIFSLSYENTRIEKKAPVFVVPPEIISFCFKDGGKKVAWKTGCADNVFVQYISQSEVGECDISDDDERTTLYIENEYLGITRFLYRVNKNIEICNQFYFQINKFGNEYEKYYLYQLRWSIKEFKNASIKSMFEYDEPIEHKLTTEGEWDYLSDEQMEFVFCYTYDFVHYEIELNSFIDFENRNSV